QDESTSADAVLASAMSALTAHETRNDSDGFIPLSEVRQEFEERLAEWLEGRSIDKEETGFPRLDLRIGGGLAKGHLYVLGGRPGSMKTAFAWLIMKNIAQAIVREGRGGCVAFASLEMKRVDIVKRAVCAEAMVDSTKLEAGQLSAAEKRRVRRVTEEILKLPVRIYDGVATSEFLHWQTLSMMAHEDVRLLVIDFAEMVADRNKNEEQRVSNIFRAAKEIAKVRNIPVMILSQLSRNVERTTSRIPGLQDLRWGGAGEAVADNVWFCFYPYMYQARGETILVPSDLGFHGLDTDYEPDRRVKEKVNKSKWFLIIAKSRYGGLGHVKFNVVPEYTLIVDYDERTERDGVVRLKSAAEDEF
ncbi:MAG: AAA family ATPase, partial [Chloroflexi bacterium]|nr:AAA family ATPase [Chloroflexota bacterium]